MKQRNLMACLLSAGMLTGSAYAQLLTKSNSGSGPGPNAAIVNQSPDGANDSLWTILGLGGAQTDSLAAQEAAQATLNSLIVNQTASGSPSSSLLKDFSVPLSSQSSSLIVQYAGYAGNNTMGVYGVTAAGAYDNQGLLQVIPGTSSGGPNPSDVIITYANGQLKVGNNTITLAPGDTSIGFYIYANGNPQTTYTSTGVAGQDFQHFVAFNASQTGLSQYAPGYILAIEDLPKGSSDFDYNDMVVSITPVPEPTTIIAGLLLLLPFGASTLRFVRRSRAA